MKNLDKNKLPIKICSDCNKNSNEVDFHMKKTGEPMYYSKRCTNCQNIYRLKLKVKNLNTATCIDCQQNSSDVQFDYHNLPSKKIFHTRCKKCTEKLKQENVNYIDERICIKCENSSNNTEFRSKYYSSNGKYCYVNHCIECEKFINYEKILKKNNITEIFCKYCKQSSLHTLFKYYILRDKFLLYDYCNECSYKNSNPEPKICNTCNKSSFDKEFKIRKSFKQTGIELVYDNICKECDSKNKKEYDSKHKKYNAKLKLYINNTKERNHNWSLENDDAINLFKQNCFYCGKESIYGKYINGIDRIDNNKGYCIENCVSCCAMCNYMKGDYSQQDFIQKCIEIVKLHSK